MTPSEAARTLRQASVDINECRIPCANCGGIGYLPAGSMCSNCVDGYVEYADETTVALLRRLADGLEELDHCAYFDGPVMDYRWALSILLGEEANDDPAIGGEEEN